MSAKPADNAEAKPKSKKMLVIIVAVLLLALAGAGAAFFVLKKKQADDEDGGDTHSTAQVKAKKPEHPPEFMPIENMVVNLADPGGNRFAQIGITLQLDAATTGETVKKYMPAVRNGILMVISRRTAEELLSATGKEQLAKDILELVRETTDLPKGKHNDPIQAVLFSSFIVQ